MDSVSPQEQAEARETAEHLVKWTHPKSTAVDYLLARALLSSQSRDRQWCLKCGTVTRDNICHCTEMGGEPQFVDYADHLLSECARLSADLDTARREAFEKAASMADEVATSEREEKAADKEAEGDDYDPHSYGAGFSDGSWVTAQNLAKAFRSLASQASA